MKRIPGEWYRSIFMTKNEEVMFFVAGRGKFVTEGREIPLEPVVCIYNPPGKLHNIINTGDEVLRFI